MAGWPQWCRGPHAPLTVPLGPPRTRTDSQHGAFRLAVAHAFRLDFLAGPRAVLACGPPAGAERAGPLRQPSSASAAWSPFQLWAPAHW